MNNKKRNGFTLVEILIVIVILGVLSATMLMSSKDAGYTAKANSIISTLQTVKDAALMYYTDNIEDNPTPLKFREKVMDYIGDIAQTGQEKFLDVDGITFTVEGRTSEGEVDNNLSAGLWYVKCDFRVLELVERDNVIEKLRSMSEDAHLRTWNENTESGYDGKTGGTDGTNIWLLIKAR